MLLDQVVDIVRALASRNIEESIKSLALHVYAACGTTVRDLPSIANPSQSARKKRQTGEESGSDESYVAYVMT